MKSKCLYITIVTILLIIIYDILAHLSIITPLVQVTLILITLFIQYKLLFFSNKYTEYSFFSKTIEKEEIILFPALDLTGFIYGSNQPIKTGIFQDVEYIKYVKYNLKNGN